MSEQIFDPTRLSLDEQVAYLLEGTYFADEGGADAASVGQASVLANNASQAGTLAPQASTLRKQMAAELKAKLAASAKARAAGEAHWPLRIYLGVDPTRESLHIGHMISCVNLRRFQRLGHQVIFLIGDYTATVGDPSGQSSERPQLTHERVLELAKFYTDQAFRLLHPLAEQRQYSGGIVTELGVEVRHNGDWLAELRFAQLAELMALFPVKQILAREDFRQRLDSGEGLRAHELLYAFMQGYDAFALNCDVQVGGYDQHFNLLAGRIIQQYFKDKLAGQDHPLFATRPAGGRSVKGPHVMLTYPLLMGTDGRKMSKSWGNTIDVLDAPADIYGKVMRISDEMIAHYIDIAVEAAPEEKQLQKAAAAGDPMGVKKWISHSLTALYCGAAAADEAAEHFRRTVQEKVFSDRDIVDSDFGKGIDSETVDRRDDQGRPQFMLFEIMVEVGLASSKSEARRLISQGGVRINGKTVTNPFEICTYIPGTLLQVGKRKIVRLM